MGRAARGARAGGAQPERPASRPSPARGRIMHMEKQARPESERAERPALQEDSLAREGEGRRAGARPAEPVDAGDAGEDGAEAPDPSDAQDAAAPELPLELPAPLRSAMKRRGFTELTSIQQTVLHAEAEGRSLRISSQTGSGKTVALGFALARELIAEGARGNPRWSKSGDEEPRRVGPVALVITPTRELAVQVRDELGWLFEEVRGVSIEVVVGGTDMGRDRRNLARLPALVVGTPGRLLDHVKSGALRTESVRHVVLDEADQMLDMGFRDELEAIVEQLPDERRSHLVSATFPPQLRELADKFQRGALHVEGTRLGAANSDIEHVVHIIKPADRYAAIVNVLLSFRGERCLVFVRRRADAAELAERLTADGFAVLPFSGELPQAQRTRTLEAFRKGVVGVLVSTDVAARGIDVPDISVVLHADVPENSEIYTHRSGRTGRAGKKGHSVMLLPFGARRHVARLLDVAGITVSSQPVPTAEKLRRAVSKETRRRAHALLEAGADRDLDSRQLAYAATLAEGRDPVAVIAALLQMAEPKLCCEPMPVAQVEQRAREDAPAPRFAPRPSPGRREARPSRDADRDLGGFRGGDARPRHRDGDGPPRAWPGRRDDEGAPFRGGEAPFADSRERAGGGLSRRFESGGFTSGGPASFSSGPSDARRVERGPREGREERFERAARGEPERQRGGGGGGDFVRFFVNWGERRGATPARLLAHLCRRTGVEGREVGAIRVQPGSSSFEVAARLAPEFERRAREPDPEEPSIRITRFAPR